MPAARRKPADDPTPPTPPEADQGGGQDDEPELIASEDIAGPDDRERIPVAGMLAHFPELREEKLTREQWQKAIDAYLGTVLEDTDLLPADDPDQLIAEEA